MLQLIVELGNRELDKDCDVDIVTVGKTTLTFLKIKEIKMVVNKGAECTRCKKIHSGMSKFGCSKWIQHPDGPELAVNCGGYAEMKFEEDSYSSNVPIINLNVIYPMNLPIVG